MSKKHVLFIVILTLACNDGLTLIHYFRVIIRNIVTIFSGKVHTWHNNLLVLSCCGCNVIPLLICSSSVVSDFLDYVGGSTFDLQSVDLFRMWRQAQDMKKREQDEQQLRVCFPEYVNIVVIDVSKRRL